MGLGQGRVGRHFWHLFLTQMVRKAIQSSTWQSAFSRWGRVLVCWAALGLAQATWADTVNAGRREAASAGSPAMTEMLAMSLAADVTQSMHWPAALDALGHQDKAVLLRQYLLFTLLQQLQGSAASQSLTVAQGIDAGRLHYPALLASTGAPIWRSSVRQWLRVSLPAARVAIPEEIDNLSADLTEEAPGFWAHRQRDKTIRTLYLQAGLRNLHTGALAINAFGLRLGDGSRGHHMSWHCDPLRNQPVQSMPPGATSQWLCRSTDLPSLQKGQTLAMALSDGHELNDWRIDARDFEQDRQRDKLVTLLAQSRQTELDAFLTRNASCERQANCIKAPPVQNGKSAKPDVAVAAAAVADPAPEPTEHRKASTRDKLILVAAAVGAAAVYGLVATYVGNWVAAALVFLITGGFAVTIIRGLWAANWADNWGGLAVVPFTAMLAVLPFVASGIAYSLYQAVCGMFGRTD